MFDLIGRKLGAYEIGEPVGAGGMATVYKAFQASMNRIVAVKVLPPQLAQNEVFLARFRQEAQVIARLEHAHILPVYDYGESDGLLYIIMRYLDGGSLQKRIDAGRLPLRDASRYLTQIASALDYAHQQGVIHRDIKPSNILIDRQGNAFLTDFGIAKMVAGSMGLTGTGVVGTAEYMSPEQGQGLTIDARSDVYSLGVVLYEMLTGRLPFSADTPIAVVLKHITAPLTPARTLVPTLPESIDVVLQRALAKKPEDRYATAGELALAFEEVIRAGRWPSTKPLDGRATPTRQSESVRPTAERRPDRPSRRAWIGLTAVAGLALLAGVIATLSRTTPPPVEDGPSVDVTTDPNLVALTPRAGSTGAPGKATSTPSAEGSAGCDELFFDDFDDPARGFPRGESDVASWGYADGEYRLLIKRTNELEARALRESYTDYEVEVDAYFASESPGDYGLILSADGATASYYAFVVDRARNFAVTRRTPSDTSIVRDWSFAPSLNAGAGVNRLRAVHIGDTIGVYGNGVLLAVFTDTLALPASHIGVMAASFGLGSLDARFDNFRVCRAPESLSPTDVSLIDNFDDDRNRWGAARFEAGSSASIEDGQLQLSIPYQEPRRFVFLPNPTFAVGDFELEVESRVSEGGPGSRAGVMFGIQDRDNNYIAYASTDGMFSLFNRVNGEQPAIAIDQPSGAIRKGNEFNRWKLSVSDGLLKVWLNDQLVQQAAIAYVPGGIGFACDPGGPPLVRCTFDNLRVRGKPSTGDVIAYPFCNCQVNARVGQPVLVVWLWKAKSVTLIEQFLSAVILDVTIDGESLVDPSQYWGEIETGEEGMQVRWLYAMPPLDPGSHTIQVSVSSELELTDGRDTNGDGRQDTYGPGRFFDGYVQVVIAP